VKETLELDTRGVDVGQGKRVLVAEPR
jgi:hypothetical protein